MVSVDLETLFYAWNLRSGDLAPGDSLGALLKVLLAATPNTSILLEVEVASFFATRISGQALPGSDRLSAILDVGIATIAARGLFLNVTAGLGITPAAPPFTISIAVPSRL